MVSQLLIASWTAYLIHELIELQQVQFSSLLAIPIDLLYSWARNQGEHLQLSALLNHYMIPDQVDTYRRAGE
jgi:hypothetical protein